MTSIIPACAGLLNDFDSRLTDCVHDADGICIDCVGAIIWTSRGERVLPYVLIRVFRGAENTIMVDLLGSHV